MLFVFPFRLAFDLPEVVGPFSDARIVRLIIWHGTTPMSGTTALIFFGYPHGPCVYQRIPLKILRGMGGAEKMLACQILDFGRLILHAFAHNEKLTTGVWR